MRRFILRISAVLVGLVVLMLVVTPSPTHAAGNVPVGAVMPMAGMLGLPSLQKMNPNSGNYMLNSDIILAAVDQMPNPTAVRITAEGWLQLAPKGAGYVGTFTDNMGNGKVYPASALNLSANSIDGLYTINTARGRFVFTISGGGTTIIGSVPAKLGAAFPFIGGAPHATTTTTLDATFGTGSAGPFPTATSGSLSLVTDANHYIVPFNKARGINSSYTYNSGGKVYSSPITTFGQFIPLDGLGGGSLILSIKVNKIMLFLSNLTEHDYGNTHEFYGNAVGMAGSQGVYVLFEAK